VHRIGQQFTFDAAHHLLGSELTCAAIAQHLACWFDNHVAGEIPRPAAFIRLADAGRQIEIEANGTIPPASELICAVTRFNVSPKLSGSGVADDRRLAPAALTALALSVCLHVMLWGDARGR
jgi:hypothetical protein